MSYSISFTKAILVVIFISDKMQQGMFEYLSSQKISEILNIPKPTLVKIFKSLALADIIEAKEGKNGGIRLCREPQNISVCDILNAIEQNKPLFQTKHNILAQGKRPDAAQKSIAELLIRSEETLKDSLKTKTIQDFLNDMSK